MEDGRNYKYVWDAFGRVVTAKNQSNTTIAEYRYNGLGYRIGLHYDADADAALESPGGSGDPQYWLVHDERWRMIGMFKDSDANLKERYVHHAAGSRGFGGSSYIDSVVLLDRDMTNGWTGAADGVLELRRGICQNWRADVVATVGVLGGTSHVIARIRYSAYGVPTCKHAADFNDDDEIDASDTDAFIALFNGDDPRADLNRDEEFDFSDHEAFSAIMGTGSGLLFGRGVLSGGEASGAGSGLKFGYAGYMHDPVIRQYHQRRRVYNPEMGRWGRRDPAGYVAGMNLYEYVSSQPVTMYDSHGLCAAGAGCGADPFDESTRHRCPLCEAACPVCIKCLFKVKQHPDRPPESNPPLPGEGGCGAGWNDWLVPDKPFGYPFDTCCNEHDTCYTTCNENCNGRKECDDGFCDCLARMCDKQESRWHRFWCHRLAGIYCAAVRVAGGMYYCDSQAYRCVCKYEW